MPPNKFRPPAGNQGAEENASGDGISFASLPQRIVIGIDLSLASTGVALVNGATVETFRIQSKGTKTDTVAERVTRLADITGRLTQLIPADTDLVVVEAPSLGQSRQAGEHLRAGLWWQLAIALHVNGHQVVEVPPALLKKYATGRGNAAKDEVLAAVVRRYPQVNVNGNDISDALVLAAMGARSLGQPIETSMPVVNLAAMDKLNWPEASA
jgi:crossover junction endodeoxyribonuclease RuvC